MSDSLAPSGIVAKLIDVSARCGNAVGMRRTPNRFSLVAAVIPALFVYNVAIAQVGGTATPTPTIGATSPLGITTGSTVSPTGIPLGSTELASPGISPAPTYSTGTIAMPSNGTTCSTLGTAPSGMYGSTATYDGGGMTMGTATAATSGMSTTSGMLETSGLSGMCGSGSSSIASSSAPTSTSPTTPGGAARTGIPLGSIEIGNLGVSSAAAVPMMSVSPTVVTVGPVPMMPTITSPPTVSSTMTSTFPCPTTGLAGMSNTTGGC
jgi:hypothetical protein